LRVAFLNNPNDPNKPKPTFSFGQSQPLGGSANPSTPGQPATTPAQQGAFGATSTPAGNPLTGAFGQQNSSAFGQPQQSGFGTVGTTGGAFGSQSRGTNTGGAFGATTTGTNTATTRPSMFGTGLTNPPSAFGTSGAPSAFGGIPVWFVEF
jgi:hypothetical protein